MKNILKATIRWIIYLIIIIVIVWKFNEIAIVTSEANPKIPTYLAMILATTFISGIERAVNKKSNTFFCVFGFFMLCTGFYFIFEKSSIYIGFLDFIPFKVRLLILSIFSSAMFWVILLLLKKPVWYLYAFILNIICEICSGEVGSTNGSNTSKNVTSYYNKKGHKVGTGINTGSGITSYYDEDGHKVGTGINMGSGITSYYDEDGHKIATKIDIN